MPVWGLKIFLLGEATSWLLRLQCKCLQRGLAVTWNWRMQVQSFDAELAFPRAPSRSLYLNLKLMTSLCGGLCFTHQHIAQFWVLAKSAPSAVAEEIPPRMGQIRISILSSRAMETWTLVISWVIWGKSRGGRWVNHWEVLVANIRQKAILVWILILRKIRRFTNLWHLLSTHIPESCSCSSWLQESSGYFFPMLCTFSYRFLFVKHIISGCKVTLMGFLLATLLHGFHPRLLSCYAFLHENQATSYTGSGNIWIIFHSFFCFTCL